VFQLRSTRGSVCDNPENSEEFQRFLDALNPHIAWELWVDILSPEHKVELGGPGGEDADRGEDEAGQGEPGRDDADIGQTRQGETIAGDDYLDHTTLEGGDRLETEVTPLIDGVSDRGKPIKKIGDCVSYNSEREREKLNAWMKELEHKAGINK